MLHAFCERDTLSRKFSFRWRKLCYKVGKRERQSGIEHVPIPWDACSAKQHLACFCIVANSSALCVGLRENRSYYEDERVKLFLRVYPHGTTAAQCLYRNRAPQTILKSLSNFWPLSLVPPTLYQKKKNTCKKKLHMSCTLIDKIDNNFFPIQSTKSSE